MQLSFYNGSLENRYKIFFSILFLFEEEIYRRRWNLVQCICISKLFRISTVTSASYSMWNNTARKSRSLVRGLL